MAYLKILDSRGNRIPKATAAGAYEGASSGRRLSTWGMSSAGPNASLYSSIATLRSRAREFTRNNSIADGAVETFVANLIGNGITPRWRRLKDNPDLKEEITGLLIAIQPVIIGLLLHFFGKSVAAQVAAKIK